MLAVFSTFATADRPPAAKARRYEDGPLRIEEFRGKPKVSLGGDAYTSATVKFGFSYSITESNQTVTATLTSFTAFAVFLPDKSWWSKRAVPELLGHEQGHFDIAEITARRLEYTFAKAIAQNRKIQATGANRDAAVKALEQDLQRVINVANEQAIQDNRDYDASTLHGLRFGRQDEFRRVQQATLKRLAKRLATIKKAN